MTLASNINVVVFICSKVMQYSNFSWDSLTIFDGDSNNSPMLRKICGNSIPPNVVSSGNKVFIHFYTDGDFTSTGFEMEYNTSSK